MKTLLVPAILLLLSSSASAESITFSWSPNNDGVTEGYNLYYDSRDNLVTTIPKGTASITVDRVPDQKAHNYFLTAYGGGLESGNSVIIPVAPEVPADPGEPIQPGTPQEYILILKPIN